MAGCPRMPQGNPRSNGTRGDAAETPAPATAPESRAAEAGGTANRPENFGDITHPRSPTKAPGAEKQAPGGGRPGAEPPTPAP